MFTVNLTCLFIFGLTFKSAIAISCHNDSNGCILPKNPIHGRWTISDDSKRASGELVEDGFVLNVTCNTHYKLNGSAALTCDNGKWSAELGECLEISTPLATVAVATSCPPIADSPSTMVTCTTVTGENINCSTPTNGTIATIKCAPFYENLELNTNPFRICTNGRWSAKMLPCRPVCGLEPVLSQNGTLSYHYPWNVIIYFERDNGEISSRFGTLINEKTILTSASALLYASNYPNISLFTPDKMTVAAGKTFQSFYASNGDHPAQFSKVQEVFVPDNFNGRATKFLADIAVIISSSLFNMTSRIQPACVDWSNIYRKAFTPPNVIAKASAPLELREHSNNSAEIFEKNIPIATDSECYEALLAKPSFGKGNINYHFAYNVIDKYCAKNIRLGKQPNCSEDIILGGGLFTKNLFNEKYYVIGVTGWGSLENDCSNTAFALFTRVSEYINFISQKTDLYSTVGRDLQTSCGVKSVHAQTLIVNGSSVAKGDYPWQVAIYKINNSTKTLICGGSLINQRIVLTAAHCVTDGKGEKLPTERFQIAAGKYYRDVDDPRDTSSVQFSTLETIIVPTEYKGGFQNFLGDIALLVTETPFNISRTIQPICLDWEVKYESQFLKPNITGFVAGWGFTEESDSVSEELLDLEVPYVDTDQCKNELPRDFETFLTNDKFCSGFLNKGKSACSGDSGGGLVFKNKVDDRYYLAGVVSVSPQSKYGCNSQQYTLYTRVSKYINNFIRETASLYWS